MENIIKLAKLNSEGLLNQNVLNMTYQIERKIANAKLDSEYILHKIILATICSEKIKELSIVLN